MTEGVDWELKDRRSAWQSITKGLCEVQAALITSGNVKFKNLEEAMKDLGKSRTVEFHLFLGLDSEAKPSISKEEPSFVCERCARHGKDTKITQGIADFSKKNYDEQLCMDCQKHVKKVIV